MVKRIFSLLLVVLSLVGPALAASPGYVDGRVIVKFKADAYQQTAKAIKGPVSSSVILEDLSKTILPESSLIMGYQRDGMLGVIKLPISVSVDAAINSFLTSGKVLYAEPDYIATPFAVYTPLPDDPFVPDDPGYSRKWDHQIMMVREAWGYGTGNTNDNVDDIRVAVIDSGVGYNHPDLMNNIAYTDGVDDDGNPVKIVFGRDTAGDKIAEDDPDGDPMDIDGHGTHVAGIIGAVGNNNEGVAGINWAVSIVPIKVFADDSTDGASYSDIIAGIDWAGINDVSVINMSLGGYGYSQALENSIAALPAQVVVVAAAGNEQNNNDNTNQRSYPASFDLPNIVSVMSTDENDDIAWYSNYGATSVDIAAAGGGHAPGVYSTVTIPAADSTADPTYDYQYMSGTSMACPQVAGALALMKSVLFADSKLAMWPDTAVKFMYLSVDKLNVLNGRCVTEGRLNVYKAIQALSSTITNITVVPAKSYLFDQLDMAVAEASAGDVLVFSSGIFFGNVTVDKSLTFKADDSITDPLNRPIISFDVDLSKNLTDPFFTLTGAGNTFIFERIIFKDSPEGVIDAQSGTTVTFTDCDFTANSNADNGGAVSAFESTLTFTNCDLYDNTSTSGGNVVYYIPSTGGGAIYADATTLTMVDCDVYQNTASVHGGGIYAVNGSFVDLNNSAMTFVMSINQSNAGSGGFIAVENSVLAMTNCALDSNTAWYNGGAVSGVESLLSFTDVTFDNNATGMLYPPYGGGALYCGGTTGSVALDRAIFDDNVSASDGGGLFVDGSTAQVIDSVFTSNQGLMNGGAVYIKNSVNSTIANTTITGSRSEFFGGGISIDASTVDITNILMADNYTYWWGGAIYIYGSIIGGSAVTLTNGTFDNNIASIAGGAVYVGDSNVVELTNIIFTKNTSYAVYEGGFVSDTVVRNCLFYSNPNGDFLDDGIISLTGAAQINTMAGSFGNIDGDPMYVDGPLGEHYLSNADAGQILDANGDIAAEQVPATTATSPCYDSGLGNAADYDVDTRGAMTDGTYDSGTADIGFHYTDAAAPYGATENVSFIINPINTGTVTPPAATLFKPYSQVVIEATAKAGYMFYRWTTPTGVALTQITEQNPDGDYYGLYDADGQLMYIDNTVRGIPFRVVIQLKSSRQLVAMFEPSMATLIISVSTGNGIIKQNGEHIPMMSYPRGQVVNLEASPTNPEHKIRWHGTDEDSLLSRTNTITLLNPGYNYVSVEFYAPQVWTVGPQGDAMFDSLQQALSHSTLKDGDVITLLPGEHYFDENNNPNDPTPSIFISRPVVIQGGDPGNPESTIIKDGILVFVGVGRDTIVRDITFDQTNHTYFTADGYNGCTPQNPYADGEHGASGGGCIMELVSLYNEATSQWVVASPTISNCRLIGGTFLVGSGANGCIQDPYHGDGGWPGISYGGGVFVGNYCKPVFENCEFIDLHVRGGHGGNSAATSRDAMPGLWGDPTEPWWAYVGHFFQVLPGFVGDDDEGTNNFEFVLPHEKKAYYPAQEEKNQYAGRGGAMYIGIGAEPVIRNCTFEDCTAMSGSSGIGLPGPRGAPTQHYRVPSYGGAVFCDAMSKPLFEDCSFKNNIAYWDQPTTHPDGGAVVNTNDYQSNGGAVYAQRNARPKFSDCYFEGNQAVMGGAICTDNIGFIDTDGTIESLIIEDCEFVANVSDIGGAIASAGGINSEKRFLSSISYPTYDAFGDVQVVTRDFNYSPGMNELLSKAAGYSMIVRSVFTGNEATIDLPDAAAAVDEQGNVIDVSSSKSGHGGAIAAYSAKTELNDCRFEENMTGGFGGAVYVSGKSLYDILPYENYSNMYLRNCLLANNYAGLGGGGLHITTYSDVQLTNCTIADNSVTIAGGKGGGMLVTDVSDVSVINSILYGSVCSRGSQIALAEPHAGEPSNADIRFSLIEPLVAEPALVDTGLNAVRTINGEDEDTIIVDDFADYYELGAFANSVSSSIDLGFTINFYNQATNSVYVSDNGCISFWKAITTFSEYTLNTNVATPVIAAFHADVDTSRGNTVTFGRGSVTIQENGQYITCKAFFVNYVEIGYYSQKQDKLNSFQLVLIDRSDRNENDFDIEFNYDMIRWEAGENQGGVEGLGGTTARVGFSDGSGVPGTFYELEGSGQPGIFLDNMTTALIAQNRDTRDVSAVGRLVFPVKEGKPQINYGSPVYTEGACTINYNAAMDMWDPASQNITTDPLWAVEGLYYLSAVDAGQDFDSPCIDMGAGLAKDYNIYRHTTRVDNRLDINTVDMGFHYTLPLTEGLYGDFDFNGVIMADEWVLWAVDYWLDGCDYPYWCHGTDLNEDGIVNLVDTTEIAPVGSVDKIPPQPLYGEDGLAVTPDFNTDEVFRMTWEVKPVSAGSGVPAITMTANVAMDNCIGDIEYYFKNTYGGGHDRDWSTDRTYTDTGLVVGNQYAYVCKARDSHGNETLSSLAVRTYAGDDSEAPITDAASTQPTKARWQIFPQTASIVDNVASVRMVAMAATDISGVQYFFECTSGNGNNSTWQDSPEYVDTGLNVGELYTYRIKTRDKSRNLNEGIWSEPASVTPDPTAIVDNDRPYPMSFITNAVQTYEDSPYFAGMQNAWHNITAVAPSNQDASYPVWYQFICLDTNGYSSPRLYKAADGTVTVAQMLDLTKKRFSSSGQYITWSVNVGFPSKTLNWKVICGDSAIGSENAYTVADQPQKVTLGVNSTDMRFVNVINWVVTYPQDGFIITHYPADFEETWGADQYITVGATDTTTTTE